MTSHLTTTSPAPADVSRSETYGACEKVVGALAAGFVLAPFLGLVGGVWGGLTARAFELGWGVW